MAAGVRVNRSLVDAVYRGEKPIPERWCPIVERITTAGTQAQQLRPDVVWVRVPCPGWPHPDGKPLVDAAPDAESEIAHG